MLNIFRKKPKEFEVELLDESIKFNVISGENLLSSALSQGLKWPHKCKVGSCGTCKYKLIKGIIKPATQKSASKNIREHPFFSMNKNKEETVLDELENLRKPRYDI